MLEEVARRRGAEERERSEIVRRTEPVKTPPPAAARSRAKRSPAA
jgi:hypothetical protein